MSYKHVTDCNVVGVDLSGPGVDVKVDAIFPPFPLPIPFSLRVEEGGPYRKVYKRKGGRREYREKVQANFQGPPGPPSDVLPANDGILRVHPGPLGSTLGSPYTQHNVTTDVAMSINQ